MCQNSVYRNGGNREALEIFQTTHMSILEKTYHETGKGMSVDILEGGRTATFHWTIQRSGKHGSSVRSLLPQDGRLPVFATFDDCHIALVQQYYRRTWTNSKQDVVR